MNGQLLIDCFSKLHDPRVRGRVNYPLIEIVVISICAIVCGANHWKTIAEFGQAREDWFRRFLKLENGIPSHQTFGRVFSLLCPESLMACFMEWSAAIAPLPKNSIIAIDGKTVRKSGCRSSDSKPLHLINAYAVERRLTLAVHKTPDKTNEIKGIPPLLKLLPIANKIITMDAMGAQKGIVKLIKLRHANYCISLKRNHKKFYNQVDNLFVKAKNLGFNAMVFKSNGTSEYEHSRIEEREYCYLPVMYLPHFKEEWKDLETLVQVKRIRHLANGDIENSKNYYFSSIPLKEYELIGHAIRSHWMVENGLHYKLDVGMNEDQCKIFHKRAAENFSTLRKLVLFCLENDKTTDGGILVKRFKAALDVNYLSLVTGF